MVKLQKINKVFLLMVIVFITLNAEEWHYKYCFSDTLVRDMEEKITTVAKNMGYTETNKGYLKTPIGNYFTKYSLSKTDAAQCLKLSTFANSIDGIPVKIRSALFLQALIQEVDSNSMYRDLELQKKSNLAFHSLNIVNTGFGVFYMANNPSLSKQAKWILGSIFSIFDAYMLYSLITLNQNSKRLDKAVAYSWFGMKPLGIMMGFSLNRQYERLRKTGYYFTNRYDF